MRTEEEEEGSIHIKSRAIAQLLISVRLCHYLVLKEIDIKCQKFFLAFSWQILLGRRSLQGCRRVIRSDEISYKIAFPKN